MRPPLLLACLPFLAACVTAPAGTGGGVEQLRTQQTSALRRAGVPDACIAQLPLATLGQVKAIADTRARTSREVLQQRQRIRTAAGKVCPEL